MIRPHAYAELGWPLVPIEPGAKRPNAQLAPNGLKNATTDPAIIQRWESACPLGNWAVVTGPESGLLVLDFDSPEAEAALVALEREHGYFPDLYPQQWTGSGGGRWQAFFAYPEGREVRNSASKLARGIDVRGAGGMAMVPPSRTAQPYEWAPDRDPWFIKPPPLLDAWITLLDPPEPSVEPWIGPPVSSQREERYAIKALESELAMVAASPKGRRNDQLNASAHALFRFCGDGRLDRNVVISGLQSAAAHAGLASPEIKSTINSAAAARGVNLG